jgi:hypothetical protein
MWPLAWPELSTRQPDHFPHLDQENPRQTVSRSSMQLAVSNSSIKRSSPFVQGRFINNSL